MNFTFGTMNPDTFNLIRLYLEASANLQEHHVIDCINEFATRFSDNQAAQEYFDGSGINAILADLQTYIIWRKAGNNFAPAFHRNPVTGTWVFPWNEEVNWTTAPEDAPLVGTIDDTRILSFPTHAHEPDENGAPNHGNR